MIFCFVLCMEQTTAVWRQAINVDCVLDDDDDDFDDEIAYFNVR